MKQPIRKKKKPTEHITGTGNGLDYCDDCPFLDFRNCVPYCSANDAELKLNKNKMVIIPDWCGNKKDEYES